MINCIIINDINGEYVPKDIFFQDWLKAVGYKKNSEITIKIVTEDEMREFNKLYKGEDKLSDTLAFPFEKLNLDNKIILGDIAMCAKKINIDPRSNLEWIWESFYGSLGLFLSPEVVLDCLFSESKNYAKKRLAERHE